MTLIMTELINLLLYKVVRFDEIFSEPVRQKYSILKPGFSMKILSINDFTTKLLSKLCDLYIGVHLKGTKRFGSKVINRQLFHRKTVFNIKYCLLLTLLPNFLVSTTIF